jgi:hypothetical protein
VTFYPKYLHWNYPDEPITGDIAMKERKQKMQMKKLDKVAGGRRGIIDPGFIVDPIHIIDPTHIVDPVDIIDPGYQPRRGQ